MESENKGYTLAVARSASKETHQKVYMKPMALYVPDVAKAAVDELIEQFSNEGDAEQKYTLTITNNNNGVSVDKDFDNLSALKAPLTGPDAVKELINIVRGYDSDEEVNVCGW